jgi:hypothetical protein
VSKQPLGEAIVAARKFLGEVHRQVAVLLESLDRQMDSKGWTPTNTNVSWGIGPQLNWESWLVSYLYRFYFPSLEKHDRVIGIIVYLELPEEGEYTEPVCLAFLARFPEQQSHRTIYDAWENDEPLLGHLRGHTTLTRVDQHHYRRFLPNASEFEGLVIPLCSLAGEGDLRTKIVEPLLAADKQKKK